MDEIKKKQLANRYVSATHKMQSGVAFMQEQGANEIKPKHLRVDINAALCDIAALGHLLIKKGIIKEEEYVEAVASQMEEEVEKYLNKIERITGKRIWLG